MRDFTSSRFMEQTTANPFLEDIFVDQPLNLPGVGRVHHHVFAQVLEAVESLHGSAASNDSRISMGRLFLISAPEAGFGKSHLVARLRDHLGTIASTLVLPFDRSRPVAWPVALSSVLRQLSGLNRSRNTSVTMMEEFSRYFLSRLVLNALASGSIRERDCPEDAAKVRQDFSLLFGRDSESKLLPWVDKRSADLVRLSNPDFARNLGMGLSELGFWTRVFVDLNQREDSALDQLRGLSNGEAKERLLQLLRIATDCRPVMLVADGLDGFFSSETAGMEITEIVNGIREKVPRSVTLLCVNDDLWESVFEHRLPSAWLDRLNGEAARLRSISPEAAMDLIKCRLKHTRVSEAAAARFADRLCDDHLWVDAGTKLSPRIILRQAADLWRREGSVFINHRVDEDDVASIMEEPLSNLTDKAEFFAALQEDRPFPPIASTPPSLPIRPEVAPTDQNPFFVTPSGMGDSELAGIDSIINDIRGSGKTVLSESPDARPAEAADLPPTAPETSPFVSNPTFQAGELGIKSVRNDEIPKGFTSPTFSFTPDAAPVQVPRLLTRAALEQRLAEYERELLSGPALILDLERMERFIRELGRQHPALGQQEERYPSSRTVCLRWNARSQSVLTGFESPRNVYFWNNLLQQSLASNRKEKIAAFSHHSEAFDPSLFSSFGFSPAVIQGRIDIIEMNDRELAMIYAAEKILSETKNSSGSENVVQWIALHLDPLWRRMIHPV